MKKFFLFLVVLTFLTSCGTSKNSGKGINLFTISQDKELGQQVATEIANNPSEYPVLRPKSYPEVYRYIYKVRDKILNSGQVQYKEEFEWDVKIIHNDTVLNAFCTPGGYIYIYTGILKYLDSEDQLAGVMGHEIAHADLRHSTRQMTTMYGIQTLLNVLAGDRELIKQVTSGLIGLKFSRNHETQADTWSVKYLCGTSYNAAGGAGFFEKIEADGGAKVPEFLSTHPNPNDRIENYYNQKTTNACAGNQTFKTEYAAMKAKLPR